MSKARRACGLTGHLAFEPPPPRRSRRPGREAAAHKRKNKQRQRSDSLNRTEAQGGAKGERRQGSERRARLGALRREAGGLLSVALIRDAYGPDLILAALAGDPTAAQIVGLIAGFSAEEDDPLCACCPAELRAVDEIGGFVIATAAIATPSVAIVSALCSSCATRPDREIVTILAANMGLRARSIDPAHLHPAAGRA